MIDDAVKPGREFRLPLKSCQRTICFNETILRHFFRIFPVRAWIVLMVWIGIQLVQGFSMDPDQGGVAYCANERTEHRWCMHPCGSNSDCREGYVCNQAGLCGSAVVPYLDANGNQITQDTGYCAAAPASATNVCGRR